MERRPVKQEFPLDVQNAFWSVDARLTALADVRVRYHKNLARYRVGEKVVVKAELDFPAIQWRVTAPVNRIVNLLSGGDEENVFSTLHEAYASTIR